MFRKVEMVKKGQTLVTSQAITFDVDSLPQAKEHNFTGATNRFEKFDAKLGLRQKVETSEGHLNQQVITLLSFYQFSNSWQWQRRWSQSVQILIKNILLKRLRNISQTTMYGLFTMARFTTSQSTSIRTREESQKSCLAKESTAPNCSGSIISGLTVTRFSAAIGWECSRKIERN